MLVTIDYGAEEIQNSGQIGHMGLDSIHGIRSTLVGIIVLSDTIANCKTDGNNPQGAAREGERIYHIENWRAGCRMFSVDIPPDLEGILSINRTYSTVLAERGCITVPQWEKIRISFPTMCRIST